MIVEKVNAALKKVPEPRSTVQYRILNEDGLIFTRQAGFVELNAKTYGHLFNLNEVETALKIIKEHEGQAYKEIDKLGTAFIKAANSPFGNPAKMFGLIIGTFLFFFVVYITLKYDLATQLANRLNNSSQ